MKLLLLLLLAPTLVFGEPCETITYSHSTQPRVHKPIRKNAAPVGTKKRIVKARVHAARIATVNRYDCPPISVPPAYARIIPGVPYIGVPPVWGYPYPMPAPTGPLPIYPGTPEDFPRTPGTPPLYNPPEGSPPIQPTDIPEPPTISVILFGLALMVARRYLKS